MEEHIENIERHLIHDLKQGSHKAFDKIYQMYSKRLYAYSLQFTKSSEESEEIVHEEYIYHIDTLSTEDTHYKLEYNEFLFRFLKTIEKLPDTQQKVIRLSRFKQLSNKEIAEKLSLSEQTVKNQLSLGLKTLKEKLNKIWLLLMLLFIN